MREAVHARAADWVLPLDADEFLRVESREALERALENAPTDRPAFLHPQSYIPTPADDPSEQNPVARIRHRRAREVSQLGKVAVPAQVAADPSLMLDQGNHFVVGDDNQRLPAEETAGSRSPTTPSARLPSSRARCSAAGSPSERDPTAGPRARFSGSAPSTSWRRAGRSPRSG